MPPSLTDKLLTAGRLAEMSVGGGAARLMLPHLAKDDEGLYTLRIFTKDGTAEHSAYLFVSGFLPSTRSPEHAGDQHVILERQMSHDDSNQEGGRAAFTCVFKVFLCSLPPPSPPYVLVSLPP